MHFILFFNKKNTTEGLSPAPAVPPACAARPAPGQSRCSGHVLGAFGQGPPGSPRCGDVAGPPLPPHAGPAPRGRQPRHRSVRDFREPAVSVISEPACSLRAQPAAALPSAWQVGRGRPDLGRNQRALGFPAAQQFGQAALDRTILGLQPSSDLIGKPFSWDINLLSCCNIPQLDNSI